MKASTISGAMNSAEPEQYFQSDLAAPRSPSQLTDWSVEQRSRIGAATGVELNAGAEVKVAQFDRSEAVAEHTEDVLRLQISVSDPLGVEELQGGRDITNNLDGFLLSKEFPTNVN